jgi:hypothetical protein
LGSIFDKSEKDIEIVELEECSGSEIKIYSVIIGEDDETLYDKFLNENLETFRDEVNDIVNKLEVIGHVTGLKSKWFKRDQGYYGDGVCYLFDDPDKSLRLYFIRFGNANKDLVIILGGGGHKPQDAHAFQEIPKLKNENYLLRKIATILHKAKDSGDLIIDENGMRMASTEDESDDDADKPLTFKL